MSSVGGGMPNRTVERHEGAGAVDHRQLWAGGWAHLGRSTAFLL